MRVLITGANGFIGKNLQIHLSENPEFEVDIFTSEMSDDDLKEKVLNTDFIFHLAGVNRPKDVNEFTQINADFTGRLCSYILKAGRNIPVVFSSSIQSKLNNPYGKSKLDAENYLLELKKQTENTVFIYNLPNVFGKWCRPNYNSVVATFCHNIANDLPITINDPASLLSLVYVDDVISGFIQLMLSHKQEHNPVYQEIATSYNITVGELAQKLYSFKDIKKTGIVERVGCGLNRALYSTYLTYIPYTDFMYSLPLHEDSRGVFVEMLKTNDSGQFSYFTAHPGITRGGHYHHSKTEKFLVIKGIAKFKFRHLITDEYIEFDVDANSPKIVETIPGWSHDITNIGTSELFVMLWANEIFDREHPDTITYKVGM